MAIRTALLVLALAAAGVSNGADSTGSGVFLLEVPELKLKVNENMTATMPHSFVSQLRLHVLRSSQEISPGKIFVRINGEAANIIMSTQAAASTLVCSFDLYFRPGFLLHSGRNSVEASAQSIYGRNYYAAFLLDVREGPDSLREIQRETTLNHPGDNPPLIVLVSPQGPIENERQPVVQGYVEGGVAPVSLTIQHQPVSLSASTLPSGARGVQLGVEGVPYSFSTQLKIVSDQDSVEVIATDAHNNRTSLLIPVIQGTRNVSRRYAVVVGVSRYQDSRIQSLHFADKDAESFRDFLLDPNGGGVQPENLIFLENQDASVARIRSALFDFLIKPGPDDLAIIYFAGHGVNDSRRPDNYYLLGYDTDAENLASTGLPMWDLPTLFERTLHANVITLVDACHSAAIGQTMPNLINDRWTTTSRNSRRAIITASNIAEFSSESEKWGGGHGVFTWFLLRGLLGEADANHDHQVSVGELFDFIQRQVVAETRGAQTPTALAGLSRGLVLTPHTSKTASLKKMFLQSALFGGVQ